MEEENSETKSLFLEKKNHKLGQEASSVGLAVQA